MGKDDEVVIALSLLGVRDSDPKEFQHDLLVAIKRYAGAMENDSIESQCTVQLTKLRNSKG